MLSTYGPRSGLDREMALKVAGAFGGGMGRLGATCGAVTGAFMVIGLEYGKTKDDDDEARERTYGLVHAFTTKFRDRNGSLLCRELLGHDLATPEGMEAVAEKQLFHVLCPRFVRDAAEILEEIL